MRRSRSSRRFGALRANLSRHAVALDGEAAQRAHAQRPRPRGDADVRAGQRARGNHLQCERRVGVELERRAAELGGNLRQRAEEMGQIEAAGVREAHVELGAGLVVRSLAPLLQRARQVNVDEAGDRLCTARQRAGLRERRGGFLEPAESDQHETLLHERWRRARRSHAGVLHLAQRYLHVLPGFVSGADLQRVARAVIVEFPVIGRMGRIQQRMGRVEARAACGGVAFTERNRCANHVGSRQQRAKVVGDSQAFERVEL